MKLHVLQDVAFLQSLIDGAGIRGVDERPARVQSVVDPVLVPSSRGSDKFLNKARSRAIKGFDFQAAIDTDIDIGLDHGEGGGRLFGFGNIFGITDKDIGFAAAPGRTSVQHLNRTFHGVGRVAGFSLFGLLEILDFINDAVDRCARLCYRPQVSATAADVVGKLVKPSPLIASYSRRPRCDGVGIGPRPRRSLYERTITEYICSLSHTYLSLFLVSIRLLWDFQWLTP